MSGLNSFVVIDIETTGLDPATCGITELGAVRFVDGKIDETYSQLVKPIMPIPAEVTRLTGIDDSMVEKAPAIEEVIEQYQDFIGNSEWIVGHNIGFDFGFLKKYMNSKIFREIDKSSIDTAVLARILFPRMSRYSLGFLAERFNIIRENSHRALDDCLVTGRVFLNLISRLAMLPLLSQKRIADSIFGPGKNKQFIESFEAMPVAVAIEEIPEDYPDNVTGDIPEETYEDYIPVDSAAVKNHFLNGGIVSKVLPSYEYRPQQAEMAIKVGEAFNRSEFLIVEAPTGVGKSLAYLLPASWWASLNNERIIISTQTKSLQAQLFYKDIPRIQKAVGYRFRAVLLKGRWNYVCLYKYSELKIEAEASFNKRDREALSPLVLWIENTRTGDISECNGFSPSRNAYLWSRISCEGGFCLGQSCPFAERCFLLKVKREVQNAQIIVVNHYLTFADFASGGDLVRESGHVIFDEAHNLEKIAASYLGNRLEKQALDGILADMYSPRPVKSGFLINLKAIAMINSLENDIESEADSAIDSIIGLSHISGSFFNELTGRFKSESKNGFSREIAYDKDNNPCAIPEAQEFVEMLESLYDKIVKLTGMIRDEGDFSKKRDVIIRLEAFAADLKKYIDVAHDVVYASSPDYVYWIELPANERFSPKLYSAPLSVGELLDGRFYDYLKTAVFTSATLTVNNNFDYIENRLGLDLTQKERVLSLSLDSPFDIDSEVAVLTAGYLPSPRDRGFEPAAAESLKSILLSGVSKIMVLFTSYSSLRSAYDTAYDMVKSNGVDLLAQDSSFNSEKLLNRFRRAKRAALFGTDSFWEGIDLPGEQLELLILFRLPFTVPDRPWFKANLKRIEESGGSSFAKLSLPDAVVKFKQGFGRLIRAATDRGCIVVLDSRIENRSFGGVFKRSVRGTKYKCGSAREMVKIIRKWHRLGD
ncbi:MAG: 3'-5' exoribonuclease [Candidatus Zixiibacteriota bacterium]|nr:MAG: 3'-5' exoribonuclease [candidate division Zixibacteria bacterium]